MALKDRMRVLTTPAEVDAFLRDNPNSAVFKAGACHQTDAAFTHVQALLETREDIPLGVIRVVEARPASNRVAELTGVRHESPQIFLFREGQAVLNYGNWNITSAALEEGLRKHFALVAPRA